MTPNHGMAADLEARRSAEKAALIRVQRRIGAIAFFTVTIHGVLGTIAAAHIREGQGRNGDAIGLLVMSVVISVITYVGTRVILDAKLWSPVWILLAAMPSAAGFVWVL
jgi:predicted acyltransferase